MKMIKADSNDELEKAEKEVKAMRELDSQFIIKIIDDFVYSQDNISFSLCIVMEKAGKDCL